MADFKVFKSVSSVSMHIIKWLMVDYDLRYSKTVSYLIWTVIWNCSVSCDFQTSTIFENFKWWYLWNGWPWPDRLCVWLYGEVFGDGRLNCSTSGCTKSEKLWMTISGTSHSINLVLDFRCQQRANHIAYLFVYPSFCHGTLKWGVVDHQFPYGANFLLVRWFH